MTKLSMVVTGILVAALAITSVLYAQAPRDERGTWGQEGSGDRGAAGPDA